MIVKNQKSKNKNSFSSGFVRLFIVCALAGFLCKTDILSYKTLCFAILFWNTFWSTFFGSPNPPKQGLGQPCAPQNTIEPHQDLAKTHQIDLEMPAQTLLNAPKTHPRCNTGALKPAKGAPDRRLPNPSKASPEVPKPFKKPCQSAF